MENNQQNQQQKPQITYSDAEQVVLDNSKTMFDILNKLLSDAKLTLSHAWCIKKNHNPQHAKVNPYEDFIKMLTWYIDQAKADYGKYCQDNGIDFTIDKAIDKLTKANEEEYKIPVAVQKHKII